jgi:hypothetical protein
MISKANPFMLRIGCDRSEEQELDPWSAKMRYCIE